ncbi:rhodanese domain-containing protein [Pseudomassariella vexata]|uniref:Rhodanese domain-containing protein n=1 Tax=Pseudomassariella vexata TaxID=1141098 RepID=A0A1Y2E025_9PEZI|nr:rhodanese domain-containing protein [Pseudomassariella vexata]ORY64890.1 rhodanese domain-containing protein [Pseudomassariella vexata]
MSSALRTTAQLTTRTTPRRSLSIAAAQTPLRRPLALTPQHRQRFGIRWSSESAMGTKIWTFEEIEALSSSKKRNATIIDTREPGELQQSGRIPGSVNIPITTSPDSFHISKDEFEDRFGFERPAQEDEVVFYCKAGVRARAAAGIAREAGWKKVGEYPGSWLDWAAKGGKVER